METENKNFRYFFLILSIIFISFLLKYASEWTHEFLGHCGFGWLVGGSPQSWYVSWIWPLEFGHAMVTFPIGTGNIPRAIMMIGGIITCLIAALASQLIIFIFSRKYILPKRQITTKTLITFHILFWYGFWAFTNSVGYLIIGGFTDFGDIHWFRLYTGIPSLAFIIIGFIAFFVLYYLISYNTCVIFRPLLPSKSSRKILVVFWIILPVIFFLILLNPAISINTWILIVGIVAMFLPSLIHLKIGNKFPQNINLS